MKNDKVTDEKWNGDVSLLPESYIIKILPFLYKKETLGIKFGLTGKGIRPNYQVINIDGSVMAMRGDTHSEFDIDKFDESRISECYTLDDILKKRIFGKS